MRRRWAWLVAAALLVILAAWLVRIPETRPPVPRPAVEMPRQLRPQERQRMLERLKPPAVDAGAGPRSRPRDPMLAAISAGASGSGLVLEVNAIRNSPLGELLLQCLARREARNALDALRQMGIDPLRDLDRVGVTEHGVVVSGDFHRANWEGLLGAASGTAYGDRGQIIPVSPRGPGGATLFATRWGDSLLHLGTSEEDARAVVDAIEGRGPQPRPLLSPDQTYGELYGVVSSGDLARTLGQGDDWAAALADAASNVELHLDARRDVALVADVRGEDARRLEDLGKSLGGALAMARVQARSSGDDETADLLQYARVTPSRGDSFSLEVALPLEVVARKLAFCRDEADAGR